MHKMFFYSELMMMHSSQDPSNSYPQHCNNNNAHQSPEGTTALPPEAVVAQQMISANVALLQNGGVKNEEVKKESTGEEESDDEEMEDEEVEDDDEEEEEEEEEESASGEEERQRHAAAGPTEGPKMHMAEPGAVAGAGTAPAGGELQTIRANLQILNHQMALLMRTLNVASCTCAECQDAQRVQHCVALPAANGNSSQLQQLHAAGLNMGGTSGGISSFAPGTPHNLQQQHQNLFSASSGGGTDVGSAGDSAPRGRRSKYCTPEEKKAVASYVQCHGATAAARKFNIPPAVAAYYHRKEFKKQGVAARRSSVSVHHAQQGQQLQAGDGTKVELGDGQQGDESGMEQIGQLWQNNYGGGYLRGRGRGRPKLIGDELDAELVEYIVQLKQTNPRAHITAAQALVIARKYIAEKAPGLLEENGGQVKLKITWAMKLVTRVQEREREIQLGLPAGSLQNLPRSAFSNAAVGGDQQQSSASSALVNELLGQNLMGNQQIDVNALLAAAAAENPQQIDLNDAAVLNLLGMAAGGSDLFSSNGGGGGTGMSHEHPGCTSTGVGGQSTSSAAAAALQQQQNQRYKQELAESDEAIRQLLSSLQGGGAEHVGGAVQHQHQQRARDGAAGAELSVADLSGHVLKQNAMRLNNNKNCLPLLIVFLTLHIILICSKEEKKDSTRPRGVSPQLAPLYQERAEFECLDGKKRIPFEQVNDDYCDCADGSDEPGTSACKNGQFYCANFGFQPQTLPTGRVNDFICDCCDGSDEWDSGIDCPNLCDALGSKAREQAKQSAEVQAAGYAKRRELAKEGAKMLEEKKLEAEKTKNELEELTELKKGAEEAKKEVEELEKEAKDSQEKEWEEAKKELVRLQAEEMFGKMEKDGDGKISSDELKRFAGFADGGDSSERAKELLKDLFKEDSEGGGDEQIDNTLLNFDAFLEKFEMAKEFVEEITEEEAKSAATTTAPEADEDKRSAEEEDDKSEESDDETRKKYDQQTRQLIEKAEEARKEYNEIADKVSDLERTVRDSESFLNVEFGADNAWAPLKGKCAELTTAQYVYILCMFDRTVQKERNGHAEISLGHWGKWAGPEDGNKFKAQLYEHGQTCWNGPERSTFVQFECGEELQLVDASEPSKCEYHFLAKSPTACADPEELKGEHAEL
uniref:Glucosidase 2 subunit beta n=1 Tax=Globodera rostochiensis TaxID=31243 RepID=A0A914HZN9_GLORO